MDGNGTAAMPIVAPNRRCRCGSAETMRAAVNVSFTMTTDTAITIKSCALPMVAPMIVALCLPCAMLIASFLLVTNRERYDEGPSACRFQRQVLAHLAPQIRPKGRRPSRHDNAVLPRFTEMHLRGPIN